MFSSILWMRISVLAEAADRPKLTPIDSLSGGGSERMHA